MRGSTNSPVKLELISVRVPADLLQKLDVLKQEEMLDRSTLIVRALKYWVSVEGKITSDQEYLTRLKNIDQNIDEVNTQIQKFTQDIGENIAKSTEEYLHEIKELRGLLSEQQKTINTLLRMIPKND